MINWKKATICDYEIASKIVKRALKRLPGRDFMALEMDIIATHICGCPLDMEKFLRAKDFDFLHDICGINRHLDRKTGKLKDCFLPRCAA
jgi:hypothetical protein